VKITAAFRTSCPLTFILIGTLSIGALTVRSQAVPYAKTFQRPQADVEAALKELQAYSGQKLPIVDGFVGTADHPLDRYQRAFYQFTIDILPNTASATVVRLTAKITAWYADPDPAKSGYEVLPSNGRLELDMLDRLSEKFGVKSGLVLPRNANLVAPKPKIDAAGHYLPESPAPLSSSGGGKAVAGNSETNETAALREQRLAEQKKMTALKSELASLQEAQHNQVHPHNLVTVKKTGTPILAKPIEGGKVLFAAAAYDEFEYIETQGEWLHVQISGASRGWLRRSQVEPMETHGTIVVPVDEPAKASAGGFKVIREDDEPFPGTWAPLKGKPTKVYWVQPAASPTAETSAVDKREFARGLLLRAAKDSTQSNSQGVVVLFDTPDGGQVSTTFVTLHDWTAGKINDQTFWQHSSIDPPELFEAARKN
jgi:hypothetical protein